MFLFKGNRNYLHSTDIYSYLEDNFSFDRIDIKFYKFLKSQPSLKIYQQSKIKRKVPHSISANVFQKNKSSIINFYPTKKKITSSYSYDESLLNKYFKINKNLISCNFTTDIKYIDLIVSMSKLWHQKKSIKKENGLL